MSRLPDRNRPAAAFAAQLDWDDMRPGRRDSRVTWGNRLARSCVAALILMLVVVPMPSGVGAIDYDPVTCARGYYSNLTAQQYLDAYNSLTDRGYCAPAGIFDRRNGYLPVFATETNVAREYGRIIVRQDGDCTVSPDTGPFWDFQVPCKAHDYCYDLRKAGFSGTVSDSGCDGWFYLLMEAHCNDRFFAADCRLVRDSYFAAVSLPMVVTSPDPAHVSIKALHSLKCAAIRNARPAELTYVVQAQCGAELHKRFKFVPDADFPGWFRIKPQHVSDKCVRANPNDVHSAGFALQQVTCSQSDWQRFAIAGSYNDNIYVLRNRGSEKCWDVPYAETRDNLIVTIYSPCHQFAHQRWVLS